MIGSSSEFAPHSTHVLQWKLDCTSGRVAVCGLSFFCCCLRRDKERSSGHRHHHQVCPNEGCTRIQSEQGGPGSTMVQKSLVVGVIDMES